MDTEKYTTYDSSIDVLVSPVTGGSKSAPDDPTPPSQWDWSSNRAIAVPTSIVSEINSNKKKEEQISFASLSLLALNKKVEPTKNKQNSNDIQKSQSMKTFESATSGASPASFSLLASLSRPTIPLLDPLSRQKDIRFVII